MVKAQQLSFCFLGKELTYSKPGLGNHQKCFVIWFVPVISVESKQKPPYMVGANFQQGYLGSAMFSYYT